ncbi:hypothetical protein [Flavobacterium sp. HJJ]|uniref:hypothetical protein n=1 Tax=Flavobacterium sp. HJJ TaxID=2783792 RepID=UPI00188A17B0|nr:hypothetical protein [Flavobacterium sp. HJJ]MBF4470111.1 hypothetical protein [Flavobacterium sp. HJJ]
MKINKITYLIIASFMLVFSACEPIVEEEHLVNSTNIDGVQLVATQSTPGGNEITIDMVTPGITGYWSNKIIGKKLTNKVKFVYPVPGKATFKYTGSLGAEFFTKTINVQIDKLDHPLDQDYYDLVGTNTTAGKTWVFDKGNAGNLWWFMSPPGSPDGAMSVWWNAGDCCGPSDANGKMHFDLNGAPNYTHYETSSAVGTKGAFNLDVINQTLTVEDATMLGSAAGNKNGVYTIVTLTATKMVLYLSNSETYGTGWTFVFRPE